MIGKLLGGRYEVLEKIGGGGMAVVYLGRCTYLQRPVAIKVLRDQFSADEEFLNRFRMEAQAAANLFHPNIVSTFDIGQDGDIHYIVMEYIQGETLKRYIQRRGVIPVPEAINIAIQVCEALKTAHRQGIIHRDIKPLNIMLTADGVVKVMDFGIARALNAASVTERGIILGSVNYMAPEQARGERATERSDLYSVGVVLYEMLTGRLPFDGESPVSIALQHLQREVVPLREINPDVPLWLEQLVMKALSKDPMQRQPSVESLLYALKHQSKSGYEFTISSEKVERVGKVMRKNWLKIGLWAGLAVVLIAGLWFGYKIWADWMYVPEVTVPSVVGENLTAVGNKLKSHGLSWVVVGERFDASAPAGIVIEQRPEAGLTVKQGREIELVVSKGPKLVENGVPNVTGLHWAEARVKLETVGLVVGNVTRINSDTVPEDYVISQNPKQGTEVVEGTAVDITLSMGPRLVEVPDVKGLELDRAKAQLASLGLDIGTVAEQKSSEPQGTVISQDPQPFTEVPPGSKVNLVISLRNPLAQVHEDQIKVLVKRKGHVVVKVQDVNGVHVVYEGDHVAGDSIPLKVSWQGETALVTVYIDGNREGENVLPLAPNSR